MHVPTPSHRGEEDILGAVQAWTLRPSRVSGAQAFLRLDITLSHTRALLSYVEDLKEYRDRAIGVDPLQLWASVAQHELPGVIFWTVDSADTVKLSVGAGFKGLGLAEKEAEGTKLSDWTTSATTLVHKAREKGTVSLVVAETEGPTAGETFLTCGVLHYSGDVVLMTVDLSTIEGGHSALQALKG